VGKCLFAHQNSYQMVMVGNKNTLPTLPGWILITFRRSDWHQLKNQLQQA